jgi:hypothetical protein
MNILRFGQEITLFRKYCLKLPNAGQPFLGNHVQDFLALAYFDVPAFKQFLYI